MSDPETIQSFRDTLRDGAALLGMHLTDRQVETFEWLTRTLLEWNQRMNLTAVREPSDVAVKHILDSLTALQATSFPDGARVLDVGAGAGFPGLALKVVRPDLRLALLDSTRKKLTFVDHVIETMGWTDAETLFGRAEELGRDPRHRERYDVVMARAVAAMRILSEFCLPFARVGGVFLAMKGPGVNEEMRPARSTVQRLGGSPAPAVPFTLPFGGGERAIIPIEKVARTPEDLPRIYRDIKRRPL